MVSKCLRKCFPLIYTKQNKRLQETSVVQCVLKQNFDLSFYFCWETSRLKMPLVPWDALLPFTLIGVSDQCSSTPATFGGLQLQLLAACLLGCVFIPLTLQLPASSPCLPLTALLLSHLHLLVCLNATIASTKQLGFLPSQVSFSTKDCP